MVIINSPVSGTLPCSSISSTSKKYSTSWTEIHFEASLPLRRAGKYEALSYRVIHRGQPTYLFNVRTGVKQSCLLSRFFLTFFVSYINRGKTKVLEIKTTITEPVRLDDDLLEEVNSFTYLGSVKIRGGRGGGGQKLTWLRDLENSSGSQKEGADLYQLTSTKNLADTLAHHHHQRRPMAQNKPDACRC